MSRVSVVLPLLLGLAVSTACTAAFAADGVLQKALAE
jgi:hypothetical protein